VTLVDSNVLIDIFGRNQQWWHWSLARAEEAAREGPLLINDVVYAETSIRFRSIEDFDATLLEAGVTVVRMPRTALFLAGKAFARYRKAGGSRTGVLPDFFNGAHAQVERLPLLTRDVRRYRHYFPEVALITPDVS
jgi:predicted nucleic acid-binding protein